LIFFVFVLFIIIIVHICQNQQLFIEFIELIDFESYHNINYLQRLFFIKKQLLLEQKYLDPIDRKVKHTFSEILDKHNHQLLPNIRIHSHEQFDIVGCDDRVYIFVKFTTTDQISICILLQILPIDNHFEFIEIVKILNNFMKEIAKVLFLIRVKISVVIFVNSHELLQINILFNIFYSDILHQIRYFDLSFAEFLSLLVVILEVFVLELLETDVLIWE